MQSKETLKKAASYLIFRDKKFFSLIITYGVIVALLNLALPLSIQVLITSIIYTAQITPVLILGLILLFLISFSALLGVLQKFLIEIYKRSSFSRIASDILLKAIYSDHQSFRAHNSSDLSSRYFEIFNIQNNVSDIIVEGFLVILTIIVSFILSSFYHPYFLILNLIILGIVWLSWALFTKKAVGYAVARSEAKFAVFAWIDDVFRMSGFFKSKTTKTYALDKGLDLIKTYIRARCKYWNISFTQLIILTLLYVAITVTLVTAGSILVIQGQLSLGQLVAAEILYTTSLYGISKLSIYYDKYYNLMASLDEMSHVFVIDDEHFGKISNSPTPIQAANQNQIINFNNVSYTDDFGRNYFYSFAINKEQSNLILTVDQNAKMVLTNLLNQYIHPDSGFVEFYGVHAADYDQHYLRDKIHMVNSSNIFGCTIGEFLQFGIADSMYNQINDILGATGLSNFIHSLPKKYETMLIGDGYPLHEQQIIILKIVKAILMNPEVIVISEIFDRIDKKIQKQILDYITKSTNITLICFSENEDNHIHYDKFLLLTSREAYHATDSNQFKTIVRKVLREA